MPERWAPEQSPCLRFARVSVLSEAFGGSDPRLEELDQGEGEKLQAGFGLMLVVDSQKEQQRRTAVHQWIPKLKGK